jgi:hypothetical protein
MNNQVDKGSIWVSVDGKQFQVIDVVVVDNNTWVHYRLINKEEPHEFSCYKESFVARFIPQPAKN